jgi:serine/threonine protein kinase
MLPCLVLEALPKTLSQVLTEEGPLQLETVRRHAYDLMCVVRIMHGGYLEVQEGGKVLQKLLVHRDINLVNSYVNAQGRFKLGDFGLCKVYDVPSSSSSSAGPLAHQEMSAAGTLRYMAPELVRPDVADVKEHGTAVDIWSVGVMLYELVSGSQQMHTGLELCEFVAGRRVVGRMATAAPEDCEGVRALVGFCCGWTIQQAIDQCAQCDAGAQFKYPPASARKSANELIVFTNICPWLHGLKGRPCGA